MSKLEWKGIQGHEIYGDWWKKIAPWLLKGCEQGREFTALDIGRACADRTMQLWIVYEKETEEVVAVVVTEIMDYPSLKTCLVNLLVGERMSEWVHYLEDVLEPWAREQGCKTIRGWCREGLMRILEPRGWEFGRVLLEKKL